VPYIVKRLISMAISIFLLAVVVFFAARVLPGDPARIRAGADATEELIARLRTEYGLDRPLFEQFGSYLGALLRGDLGTSTRTGGSVTAEFALFLPATLELSVTAFLIALILGVSLGTLAGSRAGRLPDLLVRGYTVLGTSMPIFWLSLLAVYFLAYQAQLFPSPIGRLPIGVRPPETVTGAYTLDALIAGDTALAGTAFQQLLLPALLLGVLNAVPIAKMTRSALIDSLASDFTRTARSFALPARRILLQDGLRNSAPTVITAAGLVAGHLIAGNIIVEQIFTWPGIGRYLATAIGQSDLDVVQGFVLIVGVGYIVINLIVDLLYTAADPRIKLGARP